MSGRAVTTFSRESTRIVLDEACDRIGVSHDGAELLRLGENAIYHVPSAPLVVRIARGPRYWDDATKEVAVAEWLKAAGIPAARVWPIDQPLDVGGHPVTFWRYIPGRRGGPGDVRVLGRLLKQVHELPPPADFRLPTQDPLQRVRPRLETARVDEDERSFLLKVFDELLAAVSELEFPLPEGVNHGDAHVQNLMITGGRAELIDFEGFCWGHPEWDLAMTATEYVTAGFWTTEQYGQFVDAYGFDVSTWSGFDVLRRAREISMTTWLMQNVDQDPEIRAEFEKRLTTIRAGRPTVPWHPF
ncbi:aminoglycoside phosphotransferase family protein [Pseudonocardia sp. KRD-184]|uniref:Aminoglycoside phosphotransferase family protein n=1 Tax=Pseudonocardia oceani TaxID=2792013 RepID=A0ABS6U8N1_9PSEU|nr:aminoglycoside phosphotransferase family protein [Pseudonocardia oceani]MBW0091526.1 aminoglycoside phosphotransferase family protein [Pseudonocardia oceani]MBW0096899.1 aminoglycoside phosphotransferase family protein [Pseudonocardia oceani]MBW0123714.1 aminoglycoside phosphotransferase family protein [Pseudonocardia oceani]MBW0128509.1 aminoglycoside phosphotransferase family protein [Pseudonocardia oceani]